MTQLIKMAFRDLMRNKRRAAFSSLALGMGLAVLLLVASVITGEMRGAMDTSIKLQSGDIQVRAQTYKDNSDSLAYEDLLLNPNEMAAKIKTLSPVEVATPRLFANGILSLGEENTGVSILGIEPDSKANQPYTDGMLSGEFVKSDDRSGVVIGKGVAKTLKLNVGDYANLLINTSSGNMDEQNFTVRGIFSTKTPGIDDHLILMPLTKAQAITQTENHATSIFILLNNRDQVPNVVNALKSNNVQVLSYVDLNDLLVQLENMTGGYMVVIYLIILGVTATVIVNTLIMSVYERTREIGILAAIGMKSPRIMALFFIESIFLAVGGIIIGLVIGGLMVAYATNVGFYIGGYGMNSADFLMGETIYAYLTVKDTIILTVLTFVVALAAALFPAITAARMEPVDAMRHAL